MSSPSMSQGLQSCLEPAKLMEPRVLRLKLTPSKSNFSPSIAPPTSCKTEVGGDMKIYETEEDTGGWSFLQCLKNNTKATTDDNEKVYVHPLVKRSALSEKSLEMCTECLGTETGSLISSPDQITETPNNYTSTVRESFVTKRTKRSLSFPPPLTSISTGSSGVQVRPHREGGRLVLQAVMTVSSSPTYFHAERSDGRLRLCLVKNPYSDEDDQEDEDEYDEEDDEICCNDGEDVDGKSEKVRGEIGIEKLPRPSRCKEGRRGSAGNKLLWEPFLVAT